MAAISRCFAARGGNPIKILGTMAAAPIKPRSCRRTVLNKTETGG
jgi:hypothetical protein